MSQLLAIIHSDKIERSTLREILEEQQLQSLEFDSFTTANDAISQGSCHPMVVLAKTPENKTDFGNLTEMQSRLPYSEWIFLFDPAQKTPSHQLDDYAYDLLCFPAVPPERLRVVVKRALRSAQTQWQLNNAASARQQRYQPSAYIGNSEQVKQLRSMIHQLSEVPLNTLIITGETGTGKGLVAKIVHHTGQRKKGPLIELNCAALPRELLESQLFGHESGAFTGAKSRHHGLFEQANGGTLFLDEIGDLDLDLQAKLLKAIEDKRIRRLGGQHEIQVDVQIFAAASRRLEDAVQQGVFRDDLFHRLNIFSLHLPPLRERKQDLIQLAPWFIAKFNQQAGKRVSKIPDKIWDKLFEYNWPGNVRELQNVIERSVLLAKSDALPSQWLQLSQATPKDNPLDVRQYSTQENSNTLIDDNHKSLPNKLTFTLDGKTGLDDIEIEVIQKALALCENNVSSAAKILCTTRETLRYRIKKFKITEQ